MEWKTLNGCHSCRPALNYYLLATWPGEYRDDQQSRYINERVHANIQKDGTYSVVPRMWGGVTTPDELRAIADVADKFNIPTVKVTGGQRIDLLGVKKEDLPAVWADLNDAGMVSGHAYAKGLRTVKTCVGSEWCRFGTQDSTGLGVKLEKFMWGSWTPAKVKLCGVRLSAQLRGSDLQGRRRRLRRFRFEIHFAGAAGLHIKGTEFLTKVETEEETLEVIAALTQLYREEGWYLERMYKWCDRVGLDADPQAGGRRRQEPQGAVRPLRPFAAVRAERSLGRARQPRRRPQRVRAARRTGARMTNWIEIGALERYSACSARAWCARPVGRHRGVPHRRATRCSRSTIAARTRAGRCRRASCTTSA